MHIGTNTTSKVFSDVSAALEGVLFDGMSIMAGGFGACGIPDLCIQEIRRRGIRNLTVISNNCGGEFPDRPGEGFGLWVLLKDRLVRRAISSYIGTNRTFERQYLDGDIELMLTPQGTLAEKIRAGGAGIPAFYTRTGVGTIVAEGKEHRQFDGETFILEEALTADLAIVKAWKGDPEGNLVFRKTARNFNPMMATAGRVTVAEVEHLVEPGALEPDAVHTPGIFIQRIFEGRAPKIIEQRTVRQEREA
ncbi:MAG: CoA transferase subunit A [Gammaproteobacteria bacterium]|nr:CoA transferase subunit A [Gammaproteobacteria bacterium]MDH4254049.1 CoA transferase subunit A [Gammaproteobacteria bacterium]MDH5309524.1 CoA transferase subunit A [Gammaproteobacteria bacterium]